MNNWIQLFGHFVNVSQITHIEMCVYGRDCNATFEKQDDKFMVFVAQYLRYATRGFRASSIVLSCGQRYRLAHTDPDTENVLKKLGFNLK